MKKTVLFLFFSISFSFASTSQQTVLGIGYSQNLALQKKGMHAKLGLNFETLGLAYQYESYKQLADLKETYHSINLSVKTFALGNFRNTILGVMAYNTWDNYSDYNNSIAKQKSLLPMLGLGLDYQYKTLFVYTEVKYNLNWKELLMNVGVGINLSQLMSNDDPMNNITGRKKFKNHQFKSTYPKWTKNNQKMAFK